jgi:hypothetical protein
MRVNRLTSKPLTIRNGGTFVAVCADTMGGAKARMPKKRTELLMGSSFAVYSRATDSYR